MVTKADTSSTVTFVEISQGGALLADATKLASGEQVQLILQLRSFQFLNCQARAVRKQEGQVALQFEQPLTKQQVDLLLAA